MRGAETEVKLTRNRLLMHTPTASANKARHASASTTKMLRLTEKSNKVGNLMLHTLTISRAGYIC